MADAGREGAARQSSIADDQYQDNGDPGTHVKEQTAQYVETAGVHRSAQVDATSDAPEAKMSTIEESRSTKEAGRKVRANEVKGPSIKEQDKVKDLSQASKTPAIELFAGPDFEVLTPSVLQERIINHIGDRIASNPNMRLRGRTVDYFRIDYDPAATGVTSIRSRLRKCLAADDYFGSVDLLLRHFVKSNPSAFPETQGVKGFSFGKTPWKLHGPTFRPSYIYHEHAFNPFGFTTKDRRDKIIVAVHKSVQDRCTKVNPESLLLVARSVLEERDETAKDLESYRKWSLYDTTCGFAAELSSCFDRPGCSSEEYKDLLDWVLYLFRLAHPQAILPRT